MPLIDCAYTLQLPPRNPKPNLLLSAKARSGGWSHPRLHWRVRAYGAHTASPHLMGSLSLAFAQLAKSLCGDFNSLWLWHGILGIEGDDVRGSGSPNIPESRSSFGPLGGKPLSEFHQGCCNSQAPWNPQLRILAAHGKIEAYRVLT